MIKVHKTGVIEVEIPMDECTVRERFYPLCGNAVETVVGRAVVRPDTYTQRVVFRDTQSVGTEL